RVRLISREKSRSVELFDGPPRMPCPGSAIYEMPSSAEFQKAQRVACGEARFLQSYRMELGICENDVRVKARANRAACSVRERMPREAGGADTAVRIRPHRRAGPRQLV